MSVMRPTAEIEDSVAAAVVAALSAREAIRRDLGGAQMRDFDIVFEDGHVEPLELTVHADKATVQVVSPMTIPKNERDGAKVLVSFL